MISLSLSQLSVGRLHSVILTVKIPSIQSSRKVKVSLDETVGELIRYARGKIHFLLIMIEHNMKQAIMLVILFQLALYEGR